jgi:hypothetical protein
MKAYRAAMIATALGFIAVIALILAVELSEDDRPAPPSAGDIPTAGETTGTPTEIPTPDLELQPYFQELDTIFQRASDESLLADEARLSALEAGGDIEAVKRAWSDFLTATEAVFANAVASMDAMTVPETARPGHDAFRAAADSSRTLAAQLRADISAVTTEDELDAVLENFGRVNGPLLEEADAACLDLQETALSHGIFLDLACPTDG